MQRVGAYELIGPLGRGGMAETFEARRIGPAGVTQRICLKRLLASSAEGDKSHQLFLQEARLSAHLRHANIVQVLDFGIEEGRPFLALELVQGCDLRRLLRREGKLNESLVHYLGLELGRALEFAHALPSHAGQGILHCDISPSNVLLSEAGEVKLADFGIARSLQQEEETRSRNLRGKVAYMAPEVIREGRFSTASDLFALGVTLFESLVGHRPFEGRSEVEIAQKILRDQRPRLRQLRAQPSAPLAEIIEGLLEHDPSRRSTRAHEVVDAFSHLPTSLNGRRELAERVRAQALDSGERKEEAHSPREAHPELGETETRSAMLEELALTRTRALGSELATRTRRSTDLLDVDSASLPGPEAAASKRISRHRLRSLALISSLALTLLAAVFVWRASRSSPSSDASADQSRESTGRKPLPQLAPPRRPSSLVEARRGESPASALEQTPHRETSKRSPALAPAPTQPLPSQAESQDLTAKTRGKGNSSSARRHRGTLHVVAVPYGEVWVDGQLRGKAPLRLPLRAGPHRIQVRAGREEQERSVQVDAGETSKSVFRFH